jgi:two-component sensor histidine kinase
MSSAVHEPHEQPSPSKAGDTGQLEFPDLDSVRIALDAGRIGVWSWDLKSNTVQWSGNEDGIPPSTGTFASFQNDIHPEDQPEVMAAIQESLRSGKPYHVHYRLAPRSEGDDRWFEAVASVINGEDGKPARLLGISRDVTDRQKLLRELRVRAKQQETVGRLGEQALTETDLQKLFDEIVSTIAEILDVEFVKILELVPGDAELLLRAGHGWREGLVGTAHESTGRDSHGGYALGGYALASGGPVVILDLKSETRFEAPALLLEHGINSGVSMPIAGRDGRAYGVLGAHTARRRRFGEYDVAFLSAIATIIAGAIQRRQSDQRHELMIRELRHRSGNLFAQLLALFSQTARNSRNLPELIIKYEARVLALANAHRLITEGGWRSTSIADLLRVLLAPYLERVTLAGPEVYLEPDPSFALSSAVHELATNASKYGSLSGAAGRLDVNWTVNRTGTGLALDLRWSERGGPAPRRARKNGFGSRLIEMVIQRQLDGQVERTFGPKGLDVRLMVPLTHERWPQPMAQDVDGQTAPMASYGQT